MTTVDLSSSAGLQLTDVEHSSEIPAIGRRAGALWLASEEARRAQETAKGYSTDDFSISSRVLNTVESALPSPTTPSPLPIRQALPPHIDSYPDYDIERPFSDSRLREVQLKQEMLMREQSRSVDADPSPKERAGATHASRSPPGGQTIGIGLSGNLHSSPASKEPVSPPPKRRPPVSGVTRETRQRSTSVGSTGSAASISKDTVLAQLSDAIKSQRRRNKLYEEETLLSEEELDYLTRETAVVQEKYATRFEQQEQIIESLRAELDEVKSELETAYDLEPEAAEEFLALLARRPTPTKGPVVQSFAPGALHDSSLTATPSKDAKGKTTRNQRRVNARVAARDASSATAEGTPQKGESLWRRARKLSKSRPPLVGTISLPVLDSQKKNQLGDHGGPDEKPDKSLTPAKSEKRKPPVTGKTQQQILEAEGLDGVRTRKRTNSFKKGLAGTLRVMFPSNAPEGSARPSATALYPNAPPPDAQKVQAWLTQGARGADGRAKEVGAGYSNPFDSR